MTVPLAVALLALLVALFAVVALVAVYARVRALEANRSAELSGYATTVGRLVPTVVRPRPGERGGVVAVLDADCALCHGVRNALAAAAAAQPDVRFVALVDRVEDVPAAGGGRPELLAHPDARAELYEGYSPTLLAVAADGRVTNRSFVYADTDLPALLRDLAPSHGREVSRA